MPTPDAATRYAEKVATGRIVAGKRIIGTCERHLDEYRNGGPGGSWYDPEKAWRALAFFRRLTVPEGRSRFDLNGNPRPLRLFDWEEFTVGSVYGWRQYHEDFTEIEVHRFLQVLLQAARGGGKSPLLAGWILKHLIDDGEVRPRVHLIASKTAQGKYTWDPLQTIVQDAQEGGDLLLRHTREKPGSRYMKKRDPPIVVEFTGGKAYASEMILHVTQGALGGSATLVSGEQTGRGSTGANSSLIAFDEYHDARGDDLLDRFLSGRKERLQPLFIVPTNAGDSNLTPYGKMYRRVTEAMDKGDVDPRLLPLLYEVDEWDKPFTDESCWGKANPSLQFGFPTRSSIRQQVRMARESPEKEGLVYRMSFCRWTKTLKPWLPAAVIEESLVSSLSPIEERRFLDCYVAVDVGKNRSLAAVCLLWDFGDHLEIEVTCWGCPDFLLPKSRDIKFDEWFDDGVIGCDGEMFDVEIMGEWLAPKIKFNRVRGIAMDTFKKSALITSLENHGINLVEGEEPVGYNPNHVPLWHHPQTPTGGRSKLDRKRGLWMTESIASAEDQFYGRTIRVVSNTPTRHGLETMQVDLHGGQGTTLEKQHDESPNDAGVVIVEACGPARLPEPEREAE